MVKRMVRIPRIAGGAVATLLAGAAIGVRAPWDWS
jgi:hypothetical protein